MPEAVEKRVDEVSGALCFSAMTVETPIDRLARAA